MIHGRRIIVTKKSGNNWIDAVAAAKSCEVEVACDTIPTASPDSGQWKTAEVGRKSWRVSVGALLSTVEQVLNVGQEVKLKIYDADNTTDALTGWAIVTSCQMTAQWGSLAQCAVVFEGDGELGTA